MDLRCIVGWIVLICTTAVTAGPTDYYWTKRAKLLVEEERLSFGGQMSFERGERVVNDFLMTAKHAEFNEGLRKCKKFLPTQNFMNVAKKIENSTVFKFIKDMPKGAVLHTHDVGMASYETFFKMTYVDNLYVCDVNGLLSFKFFEIPSKECDWKLLAELRRNKTRAKMIDERIKSQSSMIVDDPTAMYPNSDVAWVQFNKIFATITPLLSYRPVYLDYYYESLLNLYEDNVMYVEFRTTLPTLYDLNGTEYNELDTVRFYKETTERFISDHPDFIGAKLIYAPARSVDMAKFDEYMRILAEIKSAYPSFVAGFDLVGEEDKGKPLTYFIDKILSIGLDVKYFFHAGESNWNGMGTDENLLDAVLLNTTRIGHGYALLKHPKVLEMARTKNIAVEVNPISNQVLALVNDLRNHPASIFFAQNFPTVISNDDPGMWGSKALSYDFYEAFMGLMSRDADLRALKQLAINSLKYSAMNEQQKERALGIWEQKWKDFIAASPLLNNRHAVHVCSRNFARKRAVRRTPKSKTRRLATRSKMVR